MSANLYPVFVPSSFAAPGWPGPIEKLALPGLARTWTFVEPMGLQYVDWALAERWASTGVAWKVRALENVVALATQQPFTQELRREDGTLYGAAITHPDPVGTARLLATRVLDEAFPNGYRVALPDFTCALLVSAVASETEEAKMGQLVDVCFTRGTRPLTKGFHPPSVLEEASRLD